MIADIFESIKSILVGLGITFEEMTEEPVTIHYPDERPKLPKGSRGIPCLKVDEDGELNCVARGLCADACPTGAITVVMAEDEEGKPALTPEKYELDMGKCMVCNLCVEACPFDALEMSDHFEIAAYHPDDLIFDKDDLVEIYKKHDSVRIAEGEEI